MILEIATYCVALMIFGMLTFKTMYSLYGSLRDKKSFEEIESYEKLKKLIGRLKCPKEFACYKSGLDYLTKRGDIGLEPLFVCSEKNPQECTFSHIIDNHFFCKCPLRSYIAGELSS